MSSSGAAMQPLRPPYPPSTATLGGTPTKTLDDPITSIFLVLFLMGAAAHVTIFQVNMRRGQKFVISAMLFAFCMARITTCTMRLVWSTHLTNIQIAITAQVFVSAGVLLLFIINLIFTQRILRASHPQWAWVKWFSLAFKLYCASIVVILIAIITCTVQTFYTLSHNTRRIDRDVQLVGTTYFAVSAFAPIPLVLLREVLPKKTPHVEKFGEGRFRAKISILLFSSSILTLGAAFRAGTAYVPRPRTDPAWYHSKACFYVFNFSIEIVVVALYAIIRVDRRFIIPDESRMAGDYLTGHHKDGKERKASLLDMILSEEQVFDGEEDEEGQSEEESEGDVEKGPGIIETVVVETGIAEAEVVDTEIADNEVAGTGDAPEAKAVPEQGERSSEKGEGNVDAAILEAKSEPESGQEVGGSSEAEEKAVEVKIDPAATFEPEKGVYGALEEKDHVFEAEITPDLKSEADPEQAPPQGVGEAPEKGEGDATEPKHEPTQ